MKMELYIVLFKIRKTKKEIKLNILWNNFVKNNKNKGKFIYENKKYALNKILEINQIKSNEIKVKMILDEYCPNRSSMFDNCNS